MAYQQTPCETYRRYKYAFQPGVTRHIQSYAVQLMCYTMKLDVQRSVPHNGSRRCGPYRTRPKNKFFRSFRTQFCWAHTSGVHTGVQKLPDHASQPGVKWENLLKNERKLEGILPFVFKFFLLLSFFFIFFLAAFQRLKSPSCLEEQFFFLILSPLPQSLRRFEHEFQDKVN